MNRKTGWIQTTLTGIMCVVMGAGMAGSYWGTNVQRVAAEEITEITVEASSEEEIAGISSDVFEEEITGNVSEVLTEPEDMENILTDEDSEAVPELIGDMPEPVTAAKWTTPQEFVSQLYEVFLGRPADDSGLEFWTGKIQRQEMGAANVAYCIIFSNESKIGAMSDEEFCTKAYRLFYNRDINSSDMNTYKRYLNDGLSREFVLQSISDKYEFSTLCQQYGMYRGLIRNLPQPRDQYPELTRFMNRLYTQALDRQGEEGGLNYWCEGVINKSFSPYTVANFFINSPEFMNKNLSDEEYVKTLYRTFFGREYDQEGLDYWMGRLAAGTSRAYVQNFFEYSWEFYDIVYYFNIRSEAELWVDERNLILNSIADPSAKAAILYALDRVGYPYSQALRNTGSYYDCSSLVYYSWQYAGVDVSYRGSNTAASIAQGMVTTGKQIHATSVSELQPGDLIFWTGSDNNRYMGIWHVAMYMGAGRVIETPVNGAVGRTYVDDSLLRYEVEEGKWIVCRP